MTVVPNLFLVGAMKGGTTTLASMLSRHPDIFVPPIKEPNFFAHDINTAANPFGRVNGFDAIDVDALLDSSMDTQRQLAIVDDPVVYERLYRPGAQVRYRADCSTAYLYSRHAAASIAKACHDPRILIMLRDPVARAVSEHLMRVAIGSAPANLIEALAAEQEEIVRDRPIYHGACLYRRAGLYADQVARYIELFGRNAVKVIIFERFMDDPQTGFDSVCDFLDLPKCVVSDTKNINPARLPRSVLLNRLLFLSGGRYFLSKLSPHLPRALKTFLVRSWLAEARPSPDQAAIAQLRSFFTNEIMRLELLLGESIDEWHKNDT